VVRALLTRAEAGSIAVAGANERPSGFSVRTEHSPVAAWAFAALIHAAIVGTAAIVPQTRLPDPWKDGFTVSLVFDPAQADDPVAAAPPAEDGPSIAPEDAEVASVPPSVEFAATQPAPPPITVPAEPEQEIAVPAAAPAPPIKPQTKPARAAKATAEPAAKASALSGSSGGAVEAPSDPVAPRLAMAVPRLDPEPPTIPPRPVSGRLGNPKPDYPLEARRRRWQGDVVLRVSVSPAGRPEAIEMLSSSGHAVLDAAATTAVSSWRFDPATRGGAPVRAPVDVPIRFRLQED
jgi:protein TonB